MMYLSMNEQRLFAFEIERQDTSPRYDSRNFADDRIGMQRTFLNCRFNNTVFDAGRFLYGPHLC